MTRNTVKVQAGAGLLIEVAVAVGGETGGLKYLGVIAP